MCFAWHPWIVFVVRSGNPCGAKQRQPGKEVEERHQAQYRTKGGARRRLNQRGQHVGHHNFDHLKADRRDKRTANQCLFPWTVTR